MRLLAHDPAGDLAYSMLGPAPCLGTFVHGVFVRLAQEGRCVRDSRQPQSSPYSGKVRVMLTSPPHVDAALRAVPFVIWHCRVTLRALHFATPGNARNCSLGLTGNPNPWVPCRRSRYLSDVRHTWPWGSLCQPRVLLRTPMKADSDHFPESLCRTETTDLRRAV